MSNHDDWVSDADLEAAAKLEGQVFGRGPNGEGETPKQQLRRLFEENSAQAALGIINLSRNANSENIKFQASKYVVERVMGPLPPAQAAAVGNPNEPEPGTLEHTLNKIAQGIAAMPGSGGGEEGDTHG